jgi:hypothetical protein
VQAIAYYTAQRVSGPFSGLHVQPEAGVEEIGSGTGRGRLSRAHILVDEVLAEIPSLAAS